MILFIALMIAGAIGATRVVYQLGWGPQARSRRRLRAGRAAIADHEIVTLVGVVRAPARLLMAPLSGRACVAYHALGKLTRDVEPTIEEYRLITFELAVDGYDCVYVDGDTVQLEQRPSPVIPRKLDHEEAFVARHARRYFDARTSSFEEAIVEPGERVSVQGMAVVEPAAQGYRDGATRIRLVAHAAHPLTIGIAR